MALYKLILTSLSLFLLATFVAAQPFDVPLGERQGIIQELDFSRNSAIISGFQYDVSLTAKVEINGSYGAFTLLNEGMKVVFTYRQFETGRREITEMRQVADIDQH